MLWFFICKMRAMILSNSKDGFLSIKWVRVQWVWNPWLILSAMSVLMSVTLFCACTMRFACVYCFLFLFFWARGCLIKKILWYQKLLLNHFGNKLRENCGNGKALEKTITAMISQFPFDRFLASATNKHSQQLPLSGRFEIQTADCLSSGYYNETP